MAHEHRPVWFAGLEGEEKENFKALLGSQNKVLDRLKEICYNMLNESEKVNDKYDSPNWALRAADSVGYQRALKRVIELLEPVEQRDQR